MAQHTSGGRRATTRPVAVVGRGTPAAWRGVGGSPAVRRHAGAPAHTHLTHRGVPRAGRDVARVLTKVLTRQLPEISSQGTVYTKTCVMLDQVCRICDRTRREIHTRLRQRRVFRCAHLCQLLQQGCVGVGNRHVSSK
eukprot:scaffold36071_cov74-Phaeocystis_antarctica.AAC.6